MTQSFTAEGRAVGDEDEIVLNSVGVDIGSSTTHLMFSRLTLKRRDSRYVVADRTVLYESAIMLTPLDRADRRRIDSAALGEFFDREYARAGLRRRLRQPLEERLDHLLLLRIHLGSSRAQAVSLTMVTPSPPSR